MVVHKRKKVRKYRGSQTHGCGAKKKRRGAGNRGGRGNAGTGKRANQKKPTILIKYGNAYFGKRGFRLVKNKQKAINIYEIENKFDRFLKEGIIKKDGDLYLLNLKELKYNKLLGSGIVSKRYNITVNFCSKKAKEKIEKSGGKINVPV